MSQEEAIEIINRNCTEGSQLREACAMFIPELRESEDERIRKALVNEISGWSDVYKMFKYAPKEKVLAWFEKQKEPIDPFDTKLFQDGVKEGRRLEREDIMKERQPAEWSEEDETMLRTIISDGSRGVELDSKQISWLKSLRPLKDCSSCAKHLEGYISGRSDAENKLLEQFGALVTPEDELRIKPRWKPSEEQMEALRLAIPIVKNCISGMVDHAEILESLDSDLEAEGPPKADF